MNTQAPAGADTGSDIAEVTSWNFFGARHLGRDFPAHCHDGDQLYWCPDGSMDVIVAGRHWLVHPDTVLWFPAGTIHSVHLRGADATLSLYLDLRLRPSGPGWDRPRALVAEPLTGEILRHLPGRTVSAARRQACYQLLYSLLSEAHEREVMMSVPYHSAARIVAEAVLGDPGDRTSLRGWAERCEVSPRTIARAFETETGQTFTQWRTKVRMTAAIPLLFDGRSVAEVSGLVGYSSTGGFIAAFTSEHGLTPAAYVRAQNNGGA